MQEVITIKPKSMVLLRMRIVFKEIEGSDRQRSMVRMILVCFLCMATKI